MQDEYILVVEFVLREMAIAKVIRKMEFYSAVSPMLPLHGLCYLYFFVIPQPKI